MRIILLLLLGFFSSTVLLSTFLGFFISYIFNIFLLKIVGDYILINKQITKV